LNSFRFETGLNPVSTVANTLFSEEEESDVVTLDNEFYDSEGVKILHES